MASGWLCSQAAVRRSFLVTLCDKAQKPQAVQQEKYLEFAAWSFNLSIALWIILFVIFISYCYNIIETCGWKILFIINEEHLAKQ